MPMLLFYSCIIKFKYMYSARSGSPLNDNLHLTSNDFSGTPHFFWPGNKALSQATISSNRSGGGGKWTKISLKARMATIKDKSRFHRPSHDIIFTLCHSALLLIFML